MAKVVFNMANGKSAFWVIAILGDPGTVSRGSGWEKRRDVLENFRPDWLPLGLRGWENAYGCVLCLCFLLNFGNFHQLWLSCIPLLYNFKTVFLSRSCVTDAAYCGLKKPKVQINNVLSGYPTLVLNLNQLQQWVHGLDGWRRRRKDFTDNSLRIVWTSSTSFFPGSGSIVTPDRMSSKDNNPSLRKQPALLAPRHKRRFAEARRDGCFRGISPASKTRV